MHDVARVMYYLHCVEQCLPGVVPHKLTAYKAFEAALTGAEVCRAVELALVLAPDVMVSGGVFTRVQRNHPLLNDRQNEFYTVTLDLQHTRRVGLPELSPAAELTVSGRSVRVSRQMVRHCVAAAPLQR